MREIGGTVSVLTTTVLPPTSLPAMFLLHQPGVHYGLGEKPVHCMSLSLVYATCVCLGVTHVHMHIHMCMIHVYTLFLSVYPQHLGYDFRAPHLALVQCGGMISVIAFPGESTLILFCISGHGKWPQSEQTETPSLGLSPHPTYLHGLEEPLGKILRGAANTLHCKEGSSQGSCRGTQDQSG